MTITGYKKTLKEGDRDIYITLDLTQKRQYAKNEVNYYTARALRYHITTAADTYVSLGRKYNVSWTNIYNANKSVVGGVPNILPVGVRMVIPYE